MSDNDCTADTALQTPVNEQVTRWINACVQNEFGTRLEQSAVAELVQTVLARLSA